MKAFYEKFCKAEQALAVLMLSGIAVLVFVSALLRTIGFPINWAQDVALVAFAWLVFLGGDIAVRTTGLIGINLLVQHFPKRVQKGIDILFKCIILGFLCILVWYGVVMVQTGYKRMINTIGISYGWVTAAVPSGAFLMIISTSLKLVESIKTPTEKWGVKA